jgi:tetratricopeptide (TPR) repeat protein
MSSSPATYLARALELSRSGEVDEAVAILEEAAQEGALDSEAQSFRFMLLMRLGRAEDALVVCSECIALDAPPLARSTWLLRRGLLQINLARTDEALADLQEVMKLRASDDHDRQARKALLRVAQTMSRH